MSKFDRFCASTNTLTRSSHSLRYVLKNRSTDQPLMVIIFKLIPRETADDTSTTQNEETTTNDDELD
jgi:hypothetical protein